MTSAARARSVRPELARDLFRVEGLLPPEGWCTKPAVKTVRTLALPLIVIAGLFFSTAAFAQAPEAKAKGLQKKAMEEDYLATDFDKAAEKLKQAIAVCGNDKCAPQVRAALHRDLGVVQFVGLNDKAKGTASFTEALKIDGTIALDPDVKTRELDAAFSEAKKKAGGGGGGGGGGAANATPAGDFNHTPVPQQSARTPIPIYAEYQGETALVKVRARYKAPGMTDWKPLDLAKTGNGWGALVPCADVLPGQFSYYLQGFDANNDPIAVGGDRNNPYKVAIKQGKIDGEPPHLPNEPPPATCADTAECPPGFPCAHNAGDKLKGGGESCEDDSDCESGTCKGEVCEAPKSKHKKFWLGVSGGMDFYLMGSAKDVCSLDEANNLTPRTEGYYCTNTNSGTSGGVAYSSGSDFPFRNDGGAENRLVSEGNGGSVSSGGFRPATIRLLLSFDYALAANMMIGGRIGLAVNGFSGDAYKDDHGGLAPIHAEARFTYFFKKTALEEKGVAFYGFGALGASRFEGGIDTNVTVNGEPTRRKVTAYEISGPAFVSVGGGIRYGLSENLGLMLAPLKLNIAFGSGPVGVTLQPELAFQVGF